MKRELLEACWRLADRFGLGGAAAERLAELARILQEAPEAPTTVRDPAGVLRDHLADSLVALELSPVRRATHLADLGAGGGFPGLPLAIALPEARVSLVEANGRKCAFMADAARSLALDNVSVVHDRAETWVAGRRTVDVVTARALARLDVVAEYAAPLLHLGGHLVAWRGQRQPEVEADAEYAAERLGLAVSPPVQVFPYPEALHRYLHVMSKVSETPESFPRRPGMAAKRPLGARRLTARDASVRP